MTEYVFAGQETQTGTCIKREMEETWGDGTLTARHQHTHNSHHAMLTGDDLVGHILLKQMRMLDVVMRINMENPNISNKLDLMQRIIKQLHDYKCTQCGN